MATAVVPELPQHLAWPNPPVPLRPPVKPLDLTPPPWLQRLLDCCATPGWRRARLSALLFAGCLLGVLGISLMSRDFGAAAVDSVIEDLVFSSTLTVRQRLLAYLILPSTVAGVLGDPYADGTLQAAAEGDALALGVLGVLDELDYQFAEVIYEGPYPDFELVGASAADWTLFAVDNSTGHCLQRFTPTDQGIRNPNATGRVGDPDCAYNSTVEIPPSLDGADWTDVYWSTTLDEWAMAAEFPVANGGRVLVTTSLPLLDAALANYTTFVDAHARMHVALAGRGAIVGDDFQDEVPAAVADTSGGGDYALATADGVVYARRAFTPFHFSLSLLVAWPLEDFSEWEDEAAADVVSLIMLVGLAALCALLGTAAWTHRRQLAQGASGARAVFMGRGGGGGEELQRLTAGKSVDWLLVAIILANAFMLIGAGSLWTDAAEAQIADAQLLVTDFLGEQVREEVTKYLRFSVQTALLFEVYHSTGLFNASDPEPTLLTLAGSQAQPNRAFYFGEEEEDSWGAKRPALGTPVELVDAADMPAAGAPADAGWYTVVHASQLYAGYALPVDGGTFVTWIDSAALNLLLSTAVASASVDILYVTEPSGELMGATAGELLGPSWEDEPDRLTPDESPSSLVADTYALVLDAYGGSWAAAGDSSSHLGFLSPAGERAVSTVVISAYGLELRGLASMPWDAHMELFDSVTVTASVMGAAILAYLLYIVLQIIAWQRRSTTTTTKTPQHEPDQDDVPAMLALLRPQLDTTQESTEEPVARARRYLEAGRRGHPVTTFIAHEAAGSWARWSMLALYHSRAWTFIAAAVHLGLLLLGLAEAPSEARPAWLDETTILAIEGLLLLCVAADLTVLWGGARGLREPFGLDGSPGPVSQRDAVRACLAAAMLADLAVRLADGHILKAADQRPVPATPLVLYLAPTAALRPLALLLRFPATARALGTFVETLYSARVVLLLYLCFIVVTAALGGVLLQDSTLIDDYADFRAAVVTTWTLMTSADNYETVVRAVTDKRQGGSWLLFLYFYGALLVSAYLLGSLLIAVFEAHFEAMLQHRQQSQHSGPPVVGALAAYSVLRAADRLEPDDVAALAPAHDPLPPAFEAFVFDVQAAAADLGAGEDLQRFLRTLRHYRPPSLLHRARAVSPTQSEILFPSGVREHLRVQRYLLRSWARAYVPWSSSLMHLLAMAHLTGLCLYGTRDTEGAHSLRPHIDVALTVVLGLYAGDVSVHIFAVGAREYWFGRGDVFKRLARRFDAVLVFSSVAAVAAFAAARVDTNATRVVFGLCGLRLFSTVQSIRLPVFGLWQVLSLFLPLAACFVALLWAFAMLGVWMLAGEFQRLDGDEYDINAMNFSSLQDACVALIQVFVGSGVADAMDASIALAGPGSAFYFVAFTIVMNLLLGNIFVGIVISSYDRLDDARFAAEKAGQPMRYMQIHMAMRGREIVSVDPVDPVSPVDSSGEDSAESGGEESDGEEEVEFDGDPLDEPVEDVDAFIDGLAEEADAAETKVELDSNGSECPPPTRVELLRNDLKTCARLLLALEDEADDDDVLINQCRRSVGNVTDLLIRARKRAVKARRAAPTGTPYNTPVVGADSRGVVTVAPAPTPQMPGRSNRVAPASLDSLRGAGVGAS